jgi:hypothetical protein
MKDDDPLAAAPHEHWGLDFTQTALDFSVPIRIRPSRVRLG